MPKYATIPARKDLDPADTWATEDLFPDDAAYEQAFAEIQDYPEQMKKYQGRLSESAEVLLAFFRLSEKYEEKILRLIGYASLKADEDTTNTANAARRGRLMSWLTAAQSETAFVTPEILAIPQDHLEQMLTSNDDLAIYRRYFEQLRRQKKHILSLPEERILAGASEMADAPGQIYSALVYADLKFPSVRDYSGHIHELTSGTYISLMQSSDAYLRRSAFTTLYDEYEKRKNTFAALLDAQMKQLTFFARSRGFSSARESALFANEVPESVYDNLLKAVHDGMEPMYRYVRLRKKLMRVDDLHMYDLYVPLVKGSNRVIPYETAQEDVLAMARVFGKEYESVLRSGFDSRWTDVYENRGKRSGAYSSFTAVHPYVLLNYKDDLDSEFTVAHEMGHSMHSWLSHKYQPQVYSEYVIFVAEVASTVNEALLMQYLLRRTDDRHERAVLLNHFLEQFRSTLYRQAMFAEFELDCSRTVWEGGTLTADALCSDYQRLNELYYGPDITVDPEISFEWARIPHFYYDFYVYQYATGFSAACAISRRILCEGETAVRDYLEFLSGGCSKDPISLLKIAGVDMTTAEPVTSALSWFGELVDEFEKLTEGETVRD